jgi:serine protease
MPSGPNNLHRALVPADATPGERRALPRRPATLAALVLTLSAALLVTPAAPRAARVQGVLVRLRSTTADAAVTGSLVTGSPSAGYATGKIVVRYADAISASARSAVARAADAGSPITVGAHTRLLRLRDGTSVADALATLRHERDVVWAVPDYIARTSVVRTSVAQTSVAQTSTSLPIPNDPGTGDVAGGWQRLQWNFVGPFGVNAPQAWANVAADHAPGGRGVVVAVLDTGVAYANRGRFRRSPDFGAYQFVRGYDFVSNTPYPNDHNGHGTHVASTIAEATNNHVGLTGLAFGVRLMPVRVLNTEGEGDATVIAEGVRYAVRHGAQVINLSLEFSSDITASDIPELLEALRYAHRHGVVVVAAAGNEGHSAIAYPARAPNVIAVGATTEHGCLANFSNDGSGLTLVAPGGGPDADLPEDPNCHPDQPSGRDIYQETFTGASPRRFGIPPGYDGTSMAAPHVSATAALIIASGVLGRHPTPAQIVARLKATARPLGGPGDRALYGAGLVDAAAATAPGGPGAVPHA